MKQRYLCRYRLSRRQYTPGCPVILADGALLEDRKLSRMVAQLKFKSLSAENICGLTVSVLCLDKGGAQTGETEFTCSGLDVARDQEFGQYTAIVLPTMDVHRISVRVTAVEFASGGQWTLPENAIWGVLPGDMRPAADLWYCPCGGINREDELSCHVCGLDREIKEAVPEITPEPKIKVQIPKIKFKKPEIHISKKGILGIAAVAVLTAVVVIFAMLPKDKSPDSAGVGGIFDSKPAVSMPKLEFVLPNVTTPSDNGTVYLELEEYQEDRCRMDFEMIKALIPQAGDFGSDDYFPMGDDIDTYLTFGNRMLNLMYEKEEELHGGGWSTVYTGEGDQVNVVLVYSAPTTLCGYFVGKPEKLDNGKWEIPITLCDYDFTGLYEELHSQFLDANTQDYAFIQPDEVADCGASYFLSGWGSSNTWRGSQTEQMYYLWAQMTKCPDPFIRTMDRLDRRLPTAEDPFYRYILLLDEDRQPMGFSYFTPQWLTGPDNSGSTVWDGQVATGFGGGSGIPQDPYIINTAQQLAYLADLATNGDKNFGSYVRLDADIDLNGLDWTPIGCSNHSFTGTFDGNGHTISGLNVTQPLIYNSGDWENWQAGLFGNAYDAEIRDLTVEGEISIVQPNADDGVSRSVMAGGIVSNGSRNTIVNCHSNVDIILENYAAESGSAQVGGVVGSAYQGTVDGCSFGGNITLRVARYGSAGGVVASDNCSRIINCWNTGSIVLEALSAEANGGEAAGICPSPYDSVVENCCDLGAIVSYGNVGGIASDVYHSDEYEGEAAIRNCWSLGDLTYAPLRYRNWYPDAALAYYLREGASISHCFYLDSGAKPLGKDKIEGQVSDIYAFNSELRIETGESLVDMLNAWVDAHGEGYAHWEMDSATGYPLPTGK